MLTWKEKSKNQLNEKIQVVNKNKIIKEKKRTIRIEYINTKEKRNK
jgi:hypothetical protein